MKPARPPRKDLVRNSELILANLTEPREASEVASLTKLTPCCVQTHLRRLKAEKRIRICGWRQYDDTWARVWIAGKGPDKQKPKPLTRKQRDARRKERCKTDPELAIRRRNDFEKYYLLHKKPKVADVAAGWINNKGS